MYKITALHYQTAKKSKPFKKSVITQTHSEFVRYNKTYHQLTES